MANAGWYPDPDDPQSEQYFDGQYWTGHRRPQSLPTSDTVSIPGPAHQVPWQASAGQTSAGQTSAGQPSGAQSEPEQPVETAGASDQSAWQTTRRADLWQQTAWQPQAEQPAWQPQAEQPAWQPQPAVEQPTWQLQPEADQNAWQQQPAQGGWQSPPPAPRRNRKPLILGLVAVLVVAAGLVTWLAWPGDDAPTITYQGKEISSPDDLLTSTETHLGELVKQRHGAENDQTRCYFAQPKTPQSGAKKSDVDNSLRCGPVLFVDGSTAASYLSVPLSKADSSSGNKVTLTAKSALTGLTPATVPDDVKLVRPDGASPPEGSGGLKVPAPPAADKDVMTTATLGPVTPPGTLDGAVMVGRNTKVTLVAAGKVDRYGQGDDARSAPSGQQLMAIQVDYGSGDVGSSGSARAAVVVDGGSPKPVPETTGGDEWAVFAMPSSSTATLQLNEAGLTQTLSLPDGKPGADNIAVLAREHRTAVVGKRFDVPIRVSQGSRSVKGTFHAIATLAALNYWVPGYESQHASKPNHAVLTVKLNYTDSLQPGSTYAFNPQLLQLRLPNGETVRAHDVDRRSRYIFNVFEVPADFTRGGLYITGSQKFGSARLSVTKAKSFPIRIAAG